MNKKEEFKEFIRKNPNLIKYVNNGEMTWQKFYEMYDLYGESDDAWREYKTEERKDISDKIIKKDGILIQNTIETYRNS